MDLELALCTLYDAGLEGMVRDHISRNFRDVQKKVPRLF